MSELVHFGVTTIMANSYDPSAPANVYFSVGDAVAALALTIAVQSYLKPAYRFRLSARGIRPIYVLGLCFLGFLSILISTTLPLYNSHRSVAILYPIFWELTGSILFASAYAILSFGAVIPIKLRKGKHEKFAKSLANFLSEQQSTEYPEVVDDILNNLASLIRSSEFNERRWRERSAFFDFIHRSEIIESSYSSTLLGILSDSSICRALVESSPWRLARTFDQISSQNIYSQSAEKFIQQIAFQSIFSSNSAMRRETGYEGFANIKVFSDSLFGSNFICRNYRPLNHISLPDKLDKESYRCLALAVELMILSSIKSGYYWQVDHIFDIKDVIQDIVLYERREKSLNQNHTSHIFFISMSISQSIRKFRELINNSDVYEKFYQNNIDAKEYDFGSRHIVNAITSICYKYFESISNDFEGFNDPYWHSAFELWNEIFMRFSTDAEGIDPLQQHLAIMIEKGLEDNINGWFPAISRVVISFVGPYKTPYEDPKKSAFSLIRRSSYAAFRNFRKIRESHYLKKEDLLPTAVKFDETNNTLLFTHPSGDNIVRLSRIRPKKVNWVAADIRISKGGGAA